MKGVAERSQHIAAIYQPFIIRWVQGVFGMPDGTTAEEIAEGLTQEIKVLAIFHDVGKLALSWQQSVGWQLGNPFVARTLNHHRAPKHAPYAYPFLASLLNQVFGEPRLSAMLALAAARHHALGVTGAVQADEFVPAPGAEQVLMNLARQLADETVALAIPQALSAACQLTRADEPPGPSDDFYMLYCLAQRLVKLTDWEDAGGETIEMKGRAA